MKQLVQKLKLKTVDIWLCIQIENLSIEECEAIANELKHDQICGLLSINSKKITSECITCIVKSLKTNSRITNLTFANNDTELDDHPYLSTQCAHHLSELIKSTKTLTSVTLNNKYYANDEWAAVVANAMKVNQSITFLFMNDGLIGDKGAQLFGELLAVNRHLESLSLFSNRITGAGAKALAEGLKHNTTLTYLNVGNNDFSWDDEGNKALQERRSQKLCITFNGS